MTTDSGLIVAGAHDTPGTFALTPAPPGPNPGQPGHFAHHNWLEASVKSLAVPAPTFTYQATAYVVASTAWAAAGCDVTIVNPDTTKLLSCYCQWQTQGTFAAAVIVTITTDGATVLGVGTRGEEARQGTATKPEMLHSTRLISLNPGSTRIRLGGQLAAAGTNVQLNFMKLVVIPLAYL